MQPPTLGIFLLMPYTSTPFISMHSVFSVRIWNARYPTVASVCTHKQHRCQGFTGLDGNNWPRPPNFGEIDHVFFCMMLMLNSTLSFSRLLEFLNKDLLAISAASWLTAISWLYGMMLLCINFCVVHSALD